MTERGFTTRFVIIRSPRDAAINVVVVDEVQEVQFAVVGMRYDPEGRYENQHLFLAESPDALFALTGVEDWNEILAWMRTLWTIVYVCEDDANEEFLELANDIGLLTVCSLILCTLNNT